MRSARSASSSAVTPPSPNSTSGPNDGSCVTPTIVSTPGARHRAARPRRPSRRRGASASPRTHGATALASAQTERDAADVGLVHELRRPPAFSATGYPSSSAARDRASAADDATHGRRAPGCRSTPAARSRRRRRASTRRPAAAIQRRRRVARAAATSMSGERGHGSLGPRRASRRDRRHRPSACAAASGNANDGMVRRAVVAAQLVGHAGRARGSTRRSACRRRVGGADAIARATSSARVTSGGTKIASTASIVDRRRARRAARARSRPRSRAATRSIGLRTDASRATNCAQRVLRRRATSSGTSSPAPAHASAARMPGPARVADDRDPPAGRERLVREHLRGVEQLLERVDADHAGLAEQRVDRDVGRRERGGVRRRGPAPGGGAAALHRDDRLRARDAPGEPRELARVPERLEVEEDHVGARGRPPSTAGGRCRSRRPCCRPRRTARSRCRARPARLISSMPSPPDCDEERDVARHGLRRARTSRSSARRARCSRRRGSSGR